MDASMILLLVNAVHYFALVLRFIIFARIIMSWLPAMRVGVLAQLLYALSEPILGPVRRLLQRTPLGGPGMMLDLSPIFSFMLIWFAETLIISLLLELR